MTRCAAVVLGVIVLGGVASGLIAQEPETLPSFEIASVKRFEASDGPRMIGMRPQGERLTISGMPLTMLLTAAYQVRPSQLIDAPAWAMNEFYDIQAKAPAGTAMTAPAGAPQPVMLMLRALLIERFGLKAHKETRDLPVYALVKARADGRLGPGITTVNADCEAMMRRAREGGAPPPMPKPGERPPCSRMMGPGQLSAYATTLAAFATMLDSQAGRPVQDRTGLTGSFDIELTWTPDGVAQRGAAGPLPPAFNGRTIDPNGPSLMTAIQEQLGLKLEATKGPVEVLVIDSVSRPTPD